MSKRVANMKREDGKYEKDEDNEESEPDEDEEGDEEDKQYQLSWNA